MFRSIRLFRVLGIDIEANASWLIIFALVAFTLAEGVFPAQYEDWSAAAYWTTGIIAALLLFSTVLVHEMAHALMARAKGLEVPRITLFIFGGMAQMSGQPESAGDEFKIAAVGPATSVAVALVMGAAAVAAMRGPEPLEAVLAYLASINLALAVFNMLPGFPLDGGRVLRSSLWRAWGSFERATNAAATAGRAMGYGLMIGGGAWFLFGGGLSGLWLAFIGWFLQGAAESEAKGGALERLLESIPAHRLMRSDVPTVSPGDSLAEVVENHVLGRGARAVIVADNGAALGMITVTDLQRVPREKWATTPASEAMTPRARFKQVRPNDSAAEIARLIQSDNLNQVPVVENGHVLGMVTRREIIERLQLERTLRGSRA